MNVLTNSKNPQQGEEISMEKETSVTIGMEYTQLIWIKQRRKLDPKKGWHHLLLLIDRPNERK